MRSKKSLPKPIGYISLSPNQGGPPTKLLLKVMHPKFVTFKLRTHPPEGTITLTSSESPHLHQIP